MIKNIDALKNNGDNASKPEPPIVKDKMGKQPRYIEIKIKQKRGK